MTRKKNQDKIADTILSQKEEADKLRKIASKASGLAALLTGKPKADLMRKEILKRLPVIFMKLKESYHFYKKKSPGNIVNLSKEIDKCEKYIDEANGEVKLEKAIEILEWTEKIDNKYGFQSI